jgi:hypothetical protein
MNAKVLKQDLVVDTLKQMIPAVDVGRWRTRVARSAGSFGFVCGLLMLSAGQAIAQPASGTADSSTPPNTAGPTDIEGLWLPARGGPPPAAPGGVPSGPPPVAVVGSTLQCAPVQRLNGSGGGMVSLIIQGPHQIVMISEEDMDIARKIYLGGSHPKHVVPQPNGHSIGHWEGNTLVVDTIGYADASGKDKRQHVLERITKHGNSLDDSATITDASGAVRTQNLSWAWRPDLQINENVCEEGFDRYQVINGTLDNPNIPPSRDGQK